MGDKRLKIKQLIANNIDRLDTVLPEQQSIGIAGLSGSGKTTFSQTIGEESKKRLVSLLPKSEYQYLFPAIMETNFSAIKMEERPLVLFLGDHRFLRTHVQQSVRILEFLKNSVFVLHKNLIFRQKCFPLIMP